MYVLYLSWWCIFKRIVSLGRLARLYFNLPIHNITKNLYYTCNICSVVCMTDLLKKENLDADNDMECKYQPHAPLVVINDHAINRFTKNFNRTMCKFHFPFP